MMSNANYSLLERCLHWLALEPNSVRRLSFDLERQFALQKNITPKGAAADGQGLSHDNPVYVCGLARSGTTLLLRILDQVDVFSSLNYRDMPFVLAPNLWKRIAEFGMREASFSERAHGDGMLIGYDSAEAFEEVFWQTFSKQSKNNHCYGLSVPSRQTMDAFADYRKLVSIRKRENPGDSAPRRYLSKNNNNLTRLNCLCADPSATVLLVYRHPVDTARSLFWQHQRFLEVQQGNRFILQYMKWLGHHEFGLAHRPFCFAVPGMNPSFKPDEPDYWLDYWNAIYKNVLTLDSPQIHLIHHDTMRIEPNAFLSKLFQSLGIKVNTIALADQIWPPKAEGKGVEEFSPALVHATGQTYLDLLTNPRNVFVSNQRPVNQ